VLANRRPSPSSSPLLLSAVVIQDPWTNNSGFLGAILLIPSVRFKAAAMHQHPFSLTADQDPNLKLAMVVRYRWLQSTPLSQISLEKCSLSCHRRRQGRR
jgi:hypothetical protein